MSSKLDLETLVNLIIKLAKENHDGHFTLFAFTTGFKCAFGTPNLDSGGGREQVHKLESHESLHEALVDLISSRHTF